MPKGFNMFADDVFQDERNELDYQEWLNATDDDEEDYEQDR